MPPARSPALATAVRKPRGQGFERKAEIMAAARELFLKDGVANTSIRRIASHVGLSSTSIYVYFRDKDDLLLQLCAQTFQHMLERFREVPDDPENPFARLQELMRTYCEFALSHPDEYRLTYFVERPRFSDEVPREIPTPDSPYYYGVTSFHVVVDVLNKLRDGGYIVSADPFLTAQVLWTSVHGYVSALLAMPEFPWYPQEQMLDEMARIILTGLLAKPDPVTLPPLT
jgi:AcrR family transcriptional regulator